MHAGLHLRYARSRLPKKNPTPTEDRIRAAQEHASHFWSNRVYEHHHARVKLDDLTRDRLKTAAQQLERTPHWLIKQAIFNLLDQVERGQPVVALQDDAEASAPDEAPKRDGAVQPFLEFAQNVQPQSVLRAAITAAWRRPETECVPLLLQQARMPEAQAKAASQLAHTLAGKLRAQNPGASREGLVQGLIHEFSLSSQEGVALMCLAEALLRIPDKATRDSLIRDKIARGNWHSHIGQSPSLFVNAATWGLLLTGKLVATHNEAGLSTALTRMIGKGGEPVIRKGVDMAMRLMGEQFVTGETISEALANARHYEGQGFRYSYDMLGEAAMTDADAHAYMASYEQAIRAIGQASGGRGIYEGPGISIKLSALHPRYSRAQHERVLSELYPRVKALTVLARQFDIGINIDAEEADRLEISLDLLERLCFEPELAGWNGIGFVVQAYQKKRCPYVLDYVLDLAKRSGHRLMIRLVKGAYWDSEIKRAQIDGLEAIRCTRARFTPTCLTWPAPANCSARPKPSIRNLPRTTPTPSPRFIRWRGRITIPANMNSSACTAWANRCTTTSSASWPKANSTALAASMPRWHARNLAGLSGAPLAGKRRQHVLRQPHCGPVDRAGRPGGRSRHRGRTDGETRRHARFAAPEHSAAARTVWRRPRQ